MDGNDDEKNEISRLGERNARRRSEGDIEDSGAHRSIVGEEGEGGSADAETGDAAAFGSKDEGTGTTIVPPRGVPDGTMAALASTNAAASVSGIERGDESSLLDEKRLWSSRRFLSSSTLRRSRFSSSITTRRTLSRNGQDGSELRGNHHDLTHAKRYSSATPRLAESPSSSPAAASDQSRADGMAEVGMPTSGRSAFAPSSPRTAGKGTTLASTGSGQDNDDGGGRRGGGSSIPPATTSGSPDWVDQKGNVARSKRMMSRRGLGNSLAMSSRGGGLGSSLANQKQSAASGMIDDVGSGVSPVAEPPRSSGSNPEWVNQKSNAARRKVVGRRRFLAGSLSKSVSRTPSSEAAASSESAPRKHSPTRADEDSALAMAATTKAGLSKSLGRGAEDRKGGSDGEDLKKAEKDGFENGYGSREGKSGISDREELLAPGTDEKFGNGRKEDDGTEYAAGAGLLELDTHFEEPLSDHGAAEAEGVGGFSLELDTDVEEPLPEAHDDNGSGGGAIVGPPPPRRSGAGARSAAARGGGGVQSLGPGAYAVTGVHPMFGRRGGPPRNHRRTAGTQDESAAGGPERRLSSERAIEVEATLVRDEEEGREENRRNSVSSGNRYRRGSSAVVVAAQRIGKKVVFIDFQDRRVKWGMCALIVVFVALAVSLGVALGMDLDDDGAGTTAGAFPTSWPTVSPSSMPTTTSWDLLASHIDSAGRDGGFGSGVSLSDDGNILAASFRKPQVYEISDSVGPVGQLIDPSLLRVYFHAESQKVGGQWKHAEVNSRFPFMCSEWTTASSAVSGNGLVVATAFRECDVLRLVVFSKTAIVGDEEIAPMNGSSSPVFPPEYNVPFLMEKNFIMDDKTSVSTPLAVLLPREGKFVIVANGTHILMQSDMLEPTPIFQGGTKISMSSNGDVIAVDSTILTNSSSEVHHVKVYRYDHGTDTWDDIGLPFGRSFDVRSTAMSADGSIVAVGASDYDDSVGLPCSVCDLDPGRVSVYRFEDGSWIQMGDVLRGDNDGDNFGQSVSLSKDGAILAVGASNSSAGGAGSGLTRVYRYEESEAEKKWVQVSDDIVGEYAGEQSGSAVALSGNGTRVAVGAPNSRAGGNNAGRVSVFELG